MKIIEKISRIISIIFHPLLIPTYGMAVALQCSDLQILPVRTKIVSTAVIFVLTGLLPMIIIGGMSGLKLIKDISLNNRVDRNLPYAASLAMYVGAIFYLYSVNAPWWIGAFMCGGSLALLIVLIVNRWWKISAHAAAMGGFVGLAVAMSMRFPGQSGMLWLIIASLMIAGIVGTARLVLGRHTAAQVYAGYFDGLFCVLLMSII